MTFSTRTATNVALLIATSIILTRVMGFVIPIAGFMALRISFGEIPIILAGILFGPAAGGIAGAVADLVGFMVNSHGGAYFPGFTLTAILTGLIPGLLLYRHRHRFTLIQLIMVVLATDLLTGVFLNTLWLTIMMDTGFWVLLPARLASRLVTIPIYVTVIHLTRRAFMAAGLDTA